MDQRAIEHSLANLPIYTVRYYESIGSTNDIAAQWVEQGAPDLALVIADEQTAGRGRDGQRWHTPPGSGLAFSLVLYTQNGDSIALQQLTALGALAVQRVLKQRYLLPAQIKWPNDVLINGCKAAGILAEMHWLGDQPICSILGIGINIAPRSINQLSHGAEKASLPAICIQEAFGGPVDRLEVLQNVLYELLIWRPRLGSTDFIHAWEDALAFRDEWVYISEDGLDYSTSRAGYHTGVKERQILGLAENGALVLRSPSGKITKLADGHLHIRPIKSMLSDV